MKTDFKFSNLLGTVYCRGNLLFTPDGNSLLSPVGNRITVFDLINNKSYALPAVHRKNISRIALTPKGNLLLSIDEDGRAILTSFPRRVVLHHFSVNGSVTALQFSPSGRHFAVSVGNSLEVWQTPPTPDSNTTGELEYAPFVKHRKYTGHHGKIQTIQWSADSRFFISTSKDLTAKIWSLNPEEGFIPTTLAGHRGEVQGAWFTTNQETIFTLSQDGALFQWEYVAKPADDDSLMQDDSQFAWRIVQRHYFNQGNSKVTCAAFHHSSNLLVTGFSSGSFGLYELPEFNMIHNLSISQNDIDFVTTNKTGEWLAFGSSILGQLLVWEWQSESYILKQQSHFDSLNSISYSPSGSHIITCADDGKIKLWDTTSGFCIVTFTEHTSGVTACEFAKRGNVLFTASLDGSVRAWDLVRYRNFRTFTAPSRLSFSSLAVDPSGEVICAGSQDSFDIYVWNVQTGQLLDQLSGHEGPVSSLSFSPLGGTVISGSWDNTVRIWSVFGRTQSSEPIQLQSDVLCVTMRPDAKQVAITTLDGQLTFWSVDNASQIGGVDARRDISGGRKVTDRQIAANVAGTKSFTSVRYSADGTCVLAGGKSKYICLYECQSGGLLKKYAISINLSLTGTQEFLNSRLLTEAGPSDLLDERDGSSDLEANGRHRLPGASKGDIVSRTHKPEVRVSAVAFSPTGQSFCAGTTEGLMIYSLDNTIQFDPFDLEIEITPESILWTLKQQDYLKALAMALRLNEDSIIAQVYEKIPFDHIALVARGIPVVYVSRLLQWVAQMTEGNPHLEFNLLWIEALLTSHGQWIQNNKTQMDAVLRNVARAVNRLKADLARLADDNLYNIDYLLSRPEVEQQNGVKETKMITNGFHHDHASDVEISDEGTDNGEEWIGFSDPA